MKRGMAESYNRLVNVFVIACDTCIVGGLFHRFYHWAQDTAWEKTLQASEFQIVATISRACPSFRLGFALGQN